MEPQHHRTGQPEVRSDHATEDGFKARGRRRIEKRLSSMLDDIRSIVEPSGQTDPTFRSTRIYSPLTADEVRLRLVSRHGYKDAQLPFTRTLRTKLNDVGFRLRKVKKCQPLKKIPQTDALFDEVYRVNEEADQDDGVLRISLNTKAAVKVGSFSSGGCNRRGDSACDHDSQPGTTLTPFGISLPKTAGNHLWFVQSKVTADFMVDRLEEMVPRWKSHFDLHTLHYLS